MQDRYIHTTEWLANDKEYMELQNEYQTVEDKILTILNDAEAQASALWEKKYGKNTRPTENDMCSYFNEVIPIHYKAVNEARKLRRSQQLPIAKKIDKHVQEMAEKNPEEVYAGFFNQGGLCATAYVSDAARLTTFSDPRR